MASERARQLSAQAWCQPATERIEMIPPLAEAFAEILDPLLAQRDDLLEACEIADVYLPWGDCSLANVHAMLRAAITIAKGEPDGR